MSVGRVEVRKVIGIRCAGMRYEGDSDRSVPSKVRGSSDDGVRMSRILAASIGASRSADRAAAAVATSTVVPGEADDRIEFGIAPVATGMSTSVSASPMTAAKKLWKNASNVFERTA